MGIKKGQPSGYRPNVKLLTFEERQYLNSKYDFEIIDDDIYVKIRNYARQTKHSIHDSFFLTTKVRRITITPIAMKMWNDKFKDTYTLINVQDAINQLQTLHQDLTYQNVEKRLKNLNNFGIEVI